MHASVDLRVLGLARVLLAVHLLGEVQGELHGGQEASVESALGAVDGAADGAAGLPPGHLGRRVATRRLAYKSTARAGSKNRRLGAYLNHLRENCESQGSSLLTWEFF